MMDVPITCHGLFAFIGMPGPMEMLIIGVIAVLLFGKRLPEVGRSLGKGIVEFKRGIRGIEDEVETASNSISAKDSADEVCDPAEPTAPKFEPPASEPTDESSGQTVQQ